MHRDRKGFAAFGSVHSHCLYGVNRTALGVRKSHSGGKHDPEAALQLLTEKEGRGVLGRNQTEQSLVCTQDQGKCVFDKEVYMKLTLNGFICYS